MINIIKDIDLFDNVKDYDIVLVGTNIYCNLSQGFQRKVMLNYPYVQEMNMSTKYADKKEFYLSVDEDFPEDAALFKQFYGKKADELFDAFIEKGKSSRTLYRDTLHLMGMQMTDGTEE